MGETSRKSTNHWQNLYKPVAHMANAEHLKILKEGVEVWNRWRAENKDIQPDLSDANLDHASLNNADLRGTNLTGTSLKNADLRSADLRDSLMPYSRLNHAKLNHARLYNAFLLYIILDGANLSDADLSNANLINAQLSNANFSRADLSNTDLADANLTRVNLIDANLTNAYLSHTNLNRAIIENANMDSAIIGNTIFGQNDLSNCIGLEKVVVKSPCTIDFQTLQASKNLPKSFLLKIGLPENYIDYLPDFYENEGIKYYPIFLSHSWANKPFARKLYEALIAKGVNVFFDEKKMKPGDDIFTGISRGIELYDKTILVCSEDSLNSWWVDQELELVFEKERKLQKEAGEKTGLLIPIKIDDHIDNWPNGKRMAIKQRIIGDFRNWQDETAFDRALDSLIQALNADRKEIPPVSYLRRRPQS